MKRAERDVFFDIKEKHKDWRRKYPMQVIQPEDETAAKDNNDFEDTVRIIDDGTETEDS